ncbi:unnamed protein product [Rotaria magnacalcarata]|nr:unnamed protein product [Rotaria magnacalcarata]
MKITLYEKLQGEEFDTPQALLLRAQRIELNNAVLDARKDEYIINPTVLPTSSSLRSDHNTRWDQPSNSPISSSQYPTSSYPPPLLPTGSEFRFTHSSNATGSRYSFPSQPTSYNSRGLSTNNRSARHHRPIICYSCNQPGHISPHCPYRPKE